MDQGHHQYHQQYSAALSVDKFPQWSIQETRDFLIIRAELDPNFIQTKRNKLLWEIISTRMKENGYSRNPEQCKYKWKNLVTRYKGCETMKPEGIIRQQFPFYNEMQTIFLQRMLWLEAEGGGAATTSRKTAAAQYSSGEEDENEGEKLVANAKKNRKTKGNTDINPRSNNSIINEIRDMMNEFMRLQMQMEMKWMKAYESREEERRVKENEWRQKMEALENERLIMDMKWRECEEQRRIREEARDEKRDALVNALLNKIRREDNM